MGIAGRASGRTSVHSWSNISKHNERADIHPLGADIWIFLVAASFNCL